MEMRSGMYRRWIVSRRWRELRALTLRREPLCRECSRRGRVRVATEVHHIEPVDGAPTAAAKEALMFSRGNLEPLCHQCHREAHRALLKQSRVVMEERRRAELDAFYRDMFGEE